MVGQEICFPQVCFSKEVGDPEPLFPGEGWPVKSETLGRGDREALKATLGTSRALLPRDSGFPAQVLGSVSRGSLTCSRQGLGTRRHSADS